MFRNWYMYNALYAKIRCISKFSETALNIALNLVYSYMPSHTIKKAKKWK